jgi:hypothetical protein
MKKIFMAGAVLLFIVTAGCKLYPVGTVAITGSWFCYDSDDEYLHTFNLYDADISSVSAKSRGPVESFFWGSIYRHYPNQKRIIIQWIDAESTGMLVYGTYQKVEWIGDPYGNSITLRFYSKDNNLNAAENETGYLDRTYERKIPR